MHNRPYDMQDIFISVAFQRLETPNRIAASAFQHSWSWWCTNATILVTISP
jgi:hypothetical protein